MTRTRLFQRVTFSSRGKVAINGIHRQATLVDVSLRGVLLALHQRLLLQAGLPCTVIIDLDESGIKLSIEGLVIHSRRNLAGIKFTGMPIQTMIHLRRLLELNSGDADKVKSELSGYIKRG